MLERIILAAIITFCVYLFLNLGGSSSNRSSFDAMEDTIPRYLHRVALFSW